MEWYSIVPVVVVVVVVVLWLLVVPGHVARCALCVARCVLCVVVGVGWGPGPWS